ncbi:hypothetical protein FBULB1_10647 [Fusarium bulbicola]|nr:hypothetical protein FBULB1_10647 [Fusarium bulbicola]
MDAIKKLSGWRKTAFYLTILASILTIFLVPALIISLYLVNGGGASIFGETSILNDSCDKISRANLWIHLAINIIGTGVLGSSNFFMQVLVAPNEGRCRSRPYLKALGRDWCPFHSQLSLYFEASDIPLGALLAYHAPNKTIRSIKNSLGGQSWERLEFQDCVRRYNDLDVLMLNHRHVVMFMSNQNNPPGSQWTRSNVVKGVNGWDDREAPNSLWSAGRYDRLRDSRELITNSTNNNTVPGYYMQLNSDTGVIHMNETKYKPAFQTMKVDYCLSEKFQAPCRLSIANPLLLIVCIMCITKCLLCSYTLKVRCWSIEEPLMTVGDAIASFIAKPDTCTTGMCTLNTEDLHMRLDPDKALGSSRAWKKKQMVAGNAVNPGTWILSYMLIGSLLFLSGLLLAPALQTQSLRESRFSHHQKNADINDSGLQSASLLGLTMISNTP